MPLIHSVGLKHGCQLYVLTLQVASHQIRIPRTGAVSDLLVELRKKVELSRPDAELRVVEVIMSKIFKVRRCQPAQSHSRDGVLRPGDRRVQLDSPGIFFLVSFLRCCFRSQPSFPLVCRSCRRATLWTRSATSTGRSGRRRCPRRSCRQGRRTASCTSTTSGETSSIKTRSGAAQSGRSRVNCANARFGVLLHAAALVVLRHGWLGWLVYVLSL